MIKCKKETDKEYKIKNKDKINQQIHNRKQNDYIFKLKCQTRNILLNSFKRNGKIKSERTEKILGCDLEFFVEYFTEMLDVSEGNIVVYAMRSTISKLSNTLADPGNVDIFNRTGKPATSIQGIQFVEDDRIPPGKMLMIDGNARDVIAHVVSPKKDLQGSIRLS